MHATFPARLQRLGGDGSCISIATDDFMHIRAGQQLVSNGRDYFAFVLEPHPIVEGSYQLRPYYTRRTRLVNCSRLSQPALALSIDARSGRAVLGPQGTPFVLHRGLDDSVALYFGERRFLMFDPRDHHYYVRRVDLDHFVALSCFRVFEMPNAMANPQQVELVRFEAVDKEIVRVSRQYLTREPTGKGKPLPSSIQATEWLV